MSLEEACKYMNSISEHGPCKSNWAKAEEYYATNNIEGLLAIARGNYSWMVTKLTMPLKKFWHLVGDGRAERWNDNGQLSLERNYENGEWSK